jgi:hypothetical protein
VTAIDAKAGTITLSNKEGQTQSFTISATTKIDVNGKPGTLADVTTEMYGGVLTEDGTPVLLKAWLPSLYAKPKTSTQ